ncbi:MAG TPA: type II toxin-antitoxin system RelE/ParE family toxin [Tepidisphaeraceae bacterium]|jgi:mRNA-degrading endonuclease RelE of RelBE toxin-antitoxin system
MEVEFTADAVAQLGELPSYIIGRVDGVVRRLHDWPNVSGAKPLGGQLKGNFRIRTGDYRILFRVHGQRIIIWRIANRRDVYEE